MRIAFDHQAFCLQTMGGISRYFCSLAVQLLWQGEQPAIFAPFYRNVYLRDVPAEAVHGRAVSAYPPRLATLAVAANGWLARPMIRRFAPDVVPETFFSKRTSAPADCPRVLTVFDMISELLALDTPTPESALRETAKYAAVERADHVICISEYTRQELIRLFDVPAHKVSVVHLGCDPASGDPGEVASGAATGDRPYLLYIGLRGGYKNFAAMLQGIAASDRLKRVFDVVAFGGGAFSVQERAMIAGLGFSEGQVRHAGGNDRAMTRLYRGASALVYPSRYEGFGLPPLEAMSYGCPVAASGTASMPEVIGDAGEYFDPDRPDSIAPAIERIVFSQERTDALIELGKRRAALFTWKRCADETLAVYRQLSPGAAGAQTVSGRT